MIPKAYIGSATDGRVWLVDDGHTDDKQPFEFRVTSNPLAPGGADMDCVFERIYITLTWSITTTVNVNVLVDDVTIENSGPSIPLVKPAGGGRATRVFEKILRKPTRWRYLAAPRGTWVSTSITSMVSRPGDLIVDQVDIEYEPLRPSKEFRA